MKRILLPLSVAALAFGAFPTAQAAAAEVLEARPTSLMKVLSDEGYKPELRPGDDKTQPSIVLKASGEPLYLYFSGCKEGLCRRVTASSGFEFPNDKSHLAKTLADWNAEWYSQAYEDKDGVYLDASYLLTGGYTKVNFVEWLGTYLDDLDEFGDRLY
ncbi:MAG: hypothetical protein JWQ08_1749 [Deinococcus sp.]|nr:hypothetical protein [Deinococcus sp.]